MVVYTVEITVESGTSGGSEDEIGWCELDVDESVDVVTAGMVVTAVERVVDILPVLSPTKVDSLSTCEVSDTGGSAVVEDVVEGVVEATAGVERAGQSVTVGAQLVTVHSRVV